MSISGHRPPQFNKLQSLCFSERGREGRLVRLLADTHDLNNGVRRGLGLDEGTAFFMDRIDDPNARGEV